MKMNTKIENERSEMNVLLKNNSKSLRETLERHVSGCISWLINRFSDSEKLKYAETSSRARNLIIVVTEHRWQRCIMVAAHSIRVTFTKPTKLSIWFPARFGF